ncbi:MAG: type II toxin-antitoxin system VapC family toxin [Methylovulum sp.]|uniref:type II toxin-antitoxin system VapC family toxin n=1 Tax=Methylovulum sp. TaxID=1916980 RepID=UPI00263128F0|nr:type II toxin-antitoxin system VapC family toxin [Methylovulum sp.]MDD2724811.1 type II toxin-antitoxin system VapC family toxin [Methylovulum sp.]MDD5124057.1 type II toxin-antitoxin system VapC family toxin [Methylovulum sp.]
MIVLDTHIWLWWVHGDERLKPEYAQYLENHENTALGVSIISCWEIAKLVEYQRLSLPCPVNEWFGQALAYLNIQLLNLTPEIVIDATQLPQPFHRSRRSIKCGNYPYLWLPAYDVRRKNPKLSVCQFIASSTRLTIL